MGPTVSSGDCRKRFSTLCRGRQFAACWSSAADWLGRPIHIAKCFAVAHLDGSPRWKCHISSECRATNAPLFTGRGHWHSALCTALRWRVHLLSQQRIYLIAGSADIDCPWRFLQLLVTVNSPTTRSGSSITRCINPLSGNVTRVPSPRWPLTQSLACFKRESCLLLKKAAWLPVTLGRTPGA